MSIEEAADLEIGEMRQQEAEKAIQEARARAAEADRWWEGDRYGAQEEWDEEQKWLAVNEVGLVGAYRFKQDQTSSNKHGMAFRRMVLQG